MADRNTFFRNYDRWLADCRREYERRFGPHDGTVEFAENGAAYPHGSGGTNYVPRAVTRWEDSPHFVE